MTAATPSPREAPPRVDRVALPSGYAIGRYEVLDVLGHGGFGITYRARDQQLGREVAVKEYLPAALAVRQDGSSVLPRSTEAAADFDWGRDRFIEEGRTLAGLHEAPAIVKVFDFLETNGTAYIVMEVLRGQTLEDRVKTLGPLGAAAVNAILWPLLAGLQKVHEAGFLHRDIKPGNIVLGADDKATLIDFGAARAAMAGRTRTMTAIFTPGYAAPEQFASAKQGPWTDLYGFAATLHYAVTGKPPPSAVDRLMDDTYEPLARLRPSGFDAKLLAGIDAALSIQVEQRPQSVAAWRALLRDERVDGEATVVMAAPSASMPAAPPVAPGRPRGYVKWLAVAAGGVLFAAASAYYTFAPKPEPQVAATETASPTTQPAPEAPETAEAALNLSTADRQRIQLALSGQGFDTRGSDGSFGPRSREMIAAWQRARQHPATGYLTAAESQALLREAKPAEAASRPAPAAAAAPPAAGPSAVTAGSYAGSLSGSATGGGSPSLPPVETQLNLAGRQLTGRLVHPICGSLPVSLAVDPAGAISGTLRLYEASNCTANPASAHGRLAGGSLSLDLRGVDVSYRGTLSSPTQRSPTPPMPSGQRIDVP